MVMADLARSLSHSVDMDWMAVSSYGSGTTSSGVVRIMKDLDADLNGRNVLVVEDILDSGLTLSWLLKNLTSRGPASVEVFTLLRKPDAQKVNVSPALHRLRHPERVRGRATGSTTPSATATCAASAPSRRTSTAADRRRAVRRGRHRPFPRGFVGIWTP